MAIGERISVVGNFTNIDWRGCHLGECRGELRPERGNGELNRSAPGADGISFRARPSRLGGNARMSTLFVCDMLLKLCSQKSLNPIL